MIFKFRSIFIFILLVITQLICGCGGGTTGTGGVGSTEISGKVILQNGSPISGTSILILETGDSSITDSNGLFSIYSTVETTQLNIIVEKDDISSMINLPSIDTNIEKIELKIELNEIEKNFELKERKESIKPKRTPTQKPTNTPVLILTPKFDVTPGQHETPTPEIITPTPTLTSTVTPDIYKQVTVKGVVSAPEEFLTKGKLFVNGNEAQLNKANFSILTKSRSLITFRFELESSKGTASLRILKRNKRVVNVGLRAKYDPKDSSIILLSVREIK